jgi:uncharacterized protein DUF3309
MSAVTAFSPTQIVVNIIQTHTRREPSLISWTLRGFPTSAGFAFILVIFLLGGFSGRFGGYGYGYGFGHGRIGVILIVLVVLLLMGKL